MNGKSARVYHKVRTPEDKEFWWRLQSGNEGKALEVLERHPDVAFSFNGDSSALEYACGEGMAKLVRGLLEVGADPNYQTTSSYGRTPIDACLTRGRLRKQSKEILQSLLEAGADPNLINDLQGGQTPFLTVCSTGQKDVLDKISLMIECGASLTLPDDSGQTPLHQAACTSPEVIRLLIRKGADVNAVDLDGDTPLHAAARGGGVAAFRALLSNGADPMIKNKYGSTASDLVQMEVGWNEKGGNQKMNAIAGWRRKHLRQTAREIRKSTGNKKAASNNKLKM